MKAIRLFHLAKSGWNVLAYDLPASFAALGSVMTPEPNTGFGGNIPVFNEKQAKGIELSKKANVAAKKAMLEWAVERQGKGAEVTKDLVNTLDKVHDPIDFLNWMSAAMGQATAQIPLSVATGGVSSIGQEIGSIYMDGVQRVAREKGITPGEVIDKKLDEPGFALTFGAAAGILDRIGAGQVMKGLKKETLKAALRERAKKMIKADAVEIGTEYSQTFLEQIGSSKVAGKSFDEAWDESQTSEAAKERLEAAAQAAIGSKGMQAATFIQERNVQAPEGDLGITPEETLPPVQQEPMVDPAALKPVAPPAVTPQETPPAVAALQEVIDNPLPPPDPAVVEAMEPIIGVQQPVVELRLHLFHHQLQFLNYQFHHQLQLSNHLFLQ